MTMWEMASTGRRGKALANVVVRRLRWACSYFFQPPAASTPCTPEDVAHACIYGFAIKAFQKQGMAYDAYMLINRGFAAFRPRDDSYSICCPESFLVLLTSNAKFESHAECLARRGRGQDVATD